VTLIDSHAHLGAPELQDDMPEMLERARAAGVSGIVAIGAGYGLGATEDVVALAQAHSDVWATVGLHPHEASAWDEGMARRIEGWLARPRVVAVGECGLDYWYEHSERDAQREALRGQIRIAVSAGLPLVIHARSSRGTRDVLEEILRIFDEEGADRAGGVIHCFTGDEDFARDCLDRGFDLSFSGILTFPQAGDLRAVATRVPLDRVLIETDSPLLAPVPHRGRRNEPAYVREVALCLAELRGESPTQVGAQTAARTREIFALKDLS
jgi:TatD DNase family protein